MALREFTDGEGVEWRVWLVTPTSSGSQALAESYRAGWLCFERADGSGRRRLSLADVPAAWDALADDHLERLRQTAVVVSSRAPTMQGLTPLSAEQGLEDAQRSSVSGPRSIVGEGGEATAR